MAVITMVQAITGALRERLSADGSVVVFGEDAGLEGGVFRVTEGLQKEFSEERVFDTPLAESAIVGTALGMCCGGLRPVVEIQFSGFVYPAFNQIISHVSRFRNRTRGRYSVPMVIRMPYGGGVNALEHHSESMEALFAHIPGIYVVIPLGRGKVLAPGSDVTVVAYGAMVRQIQKAAVLAKQAGISAELIDLRSIYPLDRELIAESVKKTGRLLAVTEGPLTCGMGSEIVSTAVEEAFLSLKAPPTRLGGFDTVIPLPQGEHYYQHEPERIYYEMKKLKEY